MGEGVKGKPPFETVYDECYDSLYKYVYMRLLNRETTEDIVQDTFLKAMRSYDRFDPELASVSTWLTRIATNTMVDHLRKESHVNVISYEEYKEMGVEPYAEDEELLALTDSYATQAYCILTGLKVKERQLLSMRFGLEMSYKEMAEVLSSTEKAVGMKMNRLIEKCRKIAGSEYFEKLFEKKFE